MNTNKRCTFLSHLACEEDRAEEVKMLLHSGADLNLVNKEKKTPIQLASATLMKALHLNPLFTS
jgi:ankyrin repeat protein